MGRICGQSGGDAGRLGFVQRRAQMGRQRRDRDIRGGARRVRVQQQRSRQRGKAHHGGAAVSDCPHGADRIGVGGLQQIGDGPYREVERHDEAHAGFSQSQAKPLVRLPETHHQMRRIGSDQTTGDRIERGRNSAVAEHIAQARHGFDACAGSEHRSHRRIAPRRESTGQAD